MLSLTVGDGEDVSLKNAVFGGCKSEEDEKDEEPEMSAKELKKKAKKEAKKAKKDAKKKPSKKRKIITSIILIIVLLLLGGLTWLVLWGNDIIAKITGGQGKQVKDSRS